MVEECYDGETEYKPMIYILYFIMVRRIKRTLNRIVFRPPGTRGISVKNDSWKLCVRNILITLLFYNNITIIHLDNIFNETL